MNMDITQLVPRYLYRDKNGYALAKAIEAGMGYFFERIEAGIAAVLDVDSMPEWRLDEMAWELNCLYDFSGTIDQKRYWIRNAEGLKRLHGTPQGILNYLEGYFQNADIEEFWEYGGQPFHFRVTVSGEDYNEGKIAWAQKAILAAKNVRSVLDDVTVDNTANILVSADTDWFTVEFFYAAPETVDGAPYLGLERAGATAYDDWAEYDPETGPARTDISRTDEGHIG
jgi:P2-related tail formation protein